MQLRKPVRSVALTLAGVGIGILVNGPLVSRTALAGDRDRDRPHDEPHNPRIHHALDSLRDVQAELNDARDDYHGHKRDAQGAVQHAIDELDRIKDW